MKKITLYIAFIALTMLVACSKDKTMLASYQTTEGNALVRVIHAAPSFRLIFNQADSFNIFVNGTKINGAFITYAGVIPSGSTNNGYNSVAAGSQTFKLSVAGVLNADSIAITNFSTTLAANSLSTLFITDSSRILVPDDVTKPAVGSVNLRFVHTVMNDTAGRTVDVFSTRRNAVIVSAIKPGAVSSFQNIPYSAILDTIIVRRAGTLIPLATLNGITLNDARSYTLYFRGSGAFTTGAKIRAVASYLHQ